MGEGNPLNKMPRPAEPTAQEEILGLTNTPPKPRFTEAMRKVMAETDEKMRAEAEEKAALEKKLGIDSNPAA